MFDRNNIILILLALLALSGCQAAYRIAPENFPHINQNTPAFVLYSPDQTAHELKDIYRSHKGLVLIFWQTACPCVERYQTRVNQLFERFSKEAMGFAHVFSNQNESFESALAVYQKRRIPLSLLKDQNGALAKALKV